MPTHDTGARIGGQRPARKHPEPAKLPARIRVLAVQGLWHPHAGESRLTVGLVPRLRLAQVRAQFVSANLGEQRRSVFVSLAAPDQDQPLVEVEVLDPKLAAFRHP